MADEKTLRRVLAHELAHHEDYMVNYLKQVPVMPEKPSGAEPTYEEQVAYAEKLKDWLRKGKSLKFQMNLIGGHGLPWREIANRFNARLGADFATEKSDEQYVRTPSGKEVFLLIRKWQENYFVFQWATRLGPAAQKKLDKYWKLHPDFKLVKTPFAPFESSKHRIGDRAYSREKPETHDLLKQLWETAPDLKTAKVAASTPLSVTVERWIQQRYEHEYGQNYVSKVDKAIRSLSADPDKLYQYLGNAHEIAAFAREAVEELRNINYTDQQILQKLSSPDLKSFAGDSHTLWTYWDYFGAGDPVFKRFMQQMYKIIAIKQASKQAEWEENGGYAPWIGVDLDKTLALEPEPFEAMTIGAPIPEMVKKIQDAIAAGETIKVFTARLAVLETHDQLQEVIRAWTKEYIGVALDSTCLKDPGLKEIWDDRARQVEKDTGEFKTANRTSFYFGTDEDGAAEILQKGFDPGVFLTTSIDTALWHASRRNDETGKEPAVLKVDLPEELCAKLHADPLEQREGFYLEDAAIPPQFVKMAGPQGEGQRQHTDHSENNITMTDPEHPFEETAKTGPHAYAVVLAGLPASAAAAVVQAALTIPDEDLGIDGREDDPHITIKFGAKDDVDLLDDTLKGVKPFSVILGKLHVFVPSESSGSQAPVVAEAHAPQLKQLHDKVEAVMGNRPDDFPYTPHVTLAYVKPEAAAKYEGSDACEGITFQVNSLLLSRKGGDRKAVPFNKSAYKFIKEPRSAGDVLVAVDPKKLDEVWKNDSGFYIGPGGAGQIGDRYPRFQQWLKDNPGTPIKAPIVSWDPYNNIPSFTNGRHRFSVLRDMGAQKVYLAVPKEDVAIFQKFASTVLYHGTPAENVKSILKHGLSAGELGFVTAVPDRETALSWAEDRSSGQDAAVVVLKSSAGWKRHGANEYIREEDIPASEILKVEIYRDGKLVKAASHKTPPLSDTQYQEQPGSDGEGTQAWANIPERVQGEYEDFPLQELNPTLFKQGGTPSDWISERYREIPDVGYHVSKSRNREGIKAKGLVAQITGGTGAKTKGVWLSRTEDDLWQAFGPDTAPYFDGYRVDIRPFKDKTEHQGGIGEVLLVKRSIPVKYIEIWDNEAKVWVPLRTFAKEAATYQNKPTLLDLGGGYWLSYAQHPKESGESNTWTILNDTDKLFAVGEVTLDFYPDLPAPSIRAIRLNDKHQQQGLGPKIVQTLAKFYGGLTSDPQRNTNDYAKKMWRKIPGVVEVPSPKSNLTPPGNYFVLQAASEPLSPEDLLLVVQGERKDAIGQCTSTHGDCIPVSTAVHEALTNRYPDAQMMEGAYFRNREENEGWLHTWVEIPSQRLYVDATHDQFDGGDPIYIGRIGDVYYQEHYEIDEDYKTAAALGPLMQKLVALRPQLAAAAQQVYDENVFVNNEDPEEEHGICDEISEAMQGVIASSEDVELHEGGQDGDDHAWIIVTSDREAYGVDIAPGVYETGGGYNWKLLPGIVFKPTDVDIWPMDMIGIEASAKTAKASVPRMLAGLAAEAKKAPTFDEFEKDFIIDLKHGRYYHLTDNPNFEIDPKKGPRDMSSMAGGTMEPGKLMITSHLDNWAAYYGKSRPYVAIIDMSAVPRDAYHQVKRGFGNEFWVENPAAAKVVNVMSMAAAKASDRRFTKVLEQTILSEQDLQAFYEAATGKKVKDEPKVAALQMEMDTPGRRGNLMFRFYPLGTEDTGGPGDELGWVEVQVDGNVAFVDDVHLVKEMRGRGEGRDMYVQVLKALKQRGFIKVETMRSGPSKDARRVWESLKRDFSVDETEPNHFEVRLGAKIAFSIRDRWQYGGCWRLAFHLHQLLPGSKYVAVGPTEGNFGVDHVAVQDSQGKIWDSNGGQTPEQFLRKAGIKPEEKDWGIREVSNHEVVIHQLPDYDWANRNFSDAEEIARGILKGEKPKLQGTAAVKTAFKIEVPKSVREHFWEEPPEGNWEFWAYRSRPSALPGEKIVFTFDHAPVARAVCHHVEGPGQSQCENTGKYEKHHKVYWLPSSFVRLDGK